MSKSFERLQQFILKKMKMQHIYQPVMLMELLRKQGFATANEIATAIATYDPYFPDDWQYYLGIVKDMPARVLVKHNIVTKDTVRDGYLLLGCERLTDNEIIQLLGCCDKRLKDYLAKKGDSIWSHRKLPEQTPRQVDSVCLFCTMPANNIILENDFAYSIYKKNAAVIGHSLIVTKKHTADYFTLTTWQHEAVYNLLRAQRQLLLEQDGAITGFNILSDVGLDFGQEFLHFHAALIPRKTNDKLMLN